MKNIKNYLPLYLGCVIKCPGGNTIVTPEFLATWDFVHHGCRPYLRHLINMTDMEAKEYAGYYMKYIADNVPVKVELHESGSVKVAVGNEQHGASLFPGSKQGDRPEAFRYLLSKHFDLFGLIEDGLAIDKTTLNTPPAVPGE